MILQDQKRLAFADHLSNLIAMRTPKIICTLGMATAAERKSCG